MDNDQTIDTEFYEAEYIDEDFSPFDPDQNDTDHTPSDTDHSTADVGVKFICDYCGQNFDKKSHIGSHMMKHRNEAENFRCSEKKCGKVFRTRLLLKGHKLAAHKLKTETRATVEEKDKFHCTQCPKWFTMQIKLDAHLRKHEGLKV